jgi:hypothetical protein
VRGNLIRHVGNRDLLRRYNRNETVDLISLHPLFSSNVVYNGALRRARRLPGRMRHVQLAVGGAQ